MDAVLVLALANLAAAFASPLAVYLLLRHGPIGGDSRELAVKRLEQEDRKIRLAEDQAELVKERHGLELEIKRAQLAAQGVPQKRAVNAPLRHVER